MAKAPTQIAREAVWGSTANKIWASRRLKAPAVAAYRAAARTVLVGPPPKVLANSVPKSGTHLLSQLLGGVPKLWFCGTSLNHKQFRDDVDEPGDGRGALRPDDVRRTFHRVRNGQFVTAHFAYLEPVPQILADEGFAHFFMVRDPRDLVVSLSHYLASRENLAGYHELQAMTPSERLLVAIRGMAHTSRPGQEIASIAERLDRYAGWLQDPGTTVVRFEDLVGPRGGGTAERQQQTITTILDTCHRDSSPAAVDRLAARTFSTKSRTFRKGTIGDWQQHFGPEHEAAFAEVIGDRMATYGYA